MQPRIQINPVPSLELLAPTLLGCLIQHPTAAGRTLTSTGVQNGDRHCIVHRVPGYFQVQFGVSFLEGNTSGMQMPLRLQQLCV